MPRGGSRPGAGRPRGANYKPGNIASERGRGRPQITVIQQDLAGRIFGQWAVQETFRVHKPYGTLEVNHCVCLCGNTRTVSSYALLNGKSTKCGSCAALASGNGFEVKHRNTFLTLPDGTVEVFWGDRSFLIDAADQPLVQQFNWRVSADGYVAANSSGKVLHLHRFLLNAPADALVDHIDSNPRNNRRSNLRICTPAENSKNRQLSTANRSGFKGVYWERGMWRAHIKSDGKDYHLGYFADITDAAAAYDRAAVLLHCEFAKTNEMLGLL